MSTSGIRSEHLSLVIYIPLVGITAAHPRHTAQPRLIILVPELAARTRIEAVPAPDVALVLCASRNLVPLQCLQSGVLCQEGRGEDKVARVRAVHVGYHEGWWDGLKVTGLLVLLLVDKDALALLRLFV